MAITRKLSNRFVFELGKGNVGFDSKEFRIILMDRQSEYSFDRVNHSFYSDVVDKELVSVGYEQLIDGYFWASQAIIFWQNLIFEASSEDIGPTGSAIILQYNAEEVLNSLIVGCIDFGDDIIIKKGFSLRFRETGFDLEPGLIVSKESTYSFLIGGAKLGDVIIG